jgi:LmbE family N-acetylglucosaminyl deacetylase
MRLKPSGFCRELLERRLLSPTSAELARPAIVFAPHPDDETLGCGGTIMRKRAMEADVSIVVMTDGSRSHASRISPAELARIRADEVVGAANVLGIAEEKVRLLGFPDGELEAHERAGADIVASILLEQRPAEVYVPYRREHPRDHRATFRIVRSALGLCPSPVVVFEYPVWFWYHWPWVSMGLGPRRENLRVAANTALQAFGLRALHDLRWGTDVSDLLDRKRDALAEHRSQTSRLNGDRGWATLDDIADGEFANCFFRRYELFRRSVAGRLR